MNFQLLLIGAGGHCRACIGVIEQEDRFKIAGIVDKNRDKADVLGYPVVGTDDDLLRLRENCRHALVAVGQITSPNVRIRLYQRLRELGFELPTIISPLAHVSRHARVGQGSIIMHQALVNAGAVVGENCIINTRALVEHLVEHDAVIEDHCHIATGAIINGGAAVGQGSFVGSNAVVLQNVVIGSGCVVGADARVLRHLAENSRHK